MNKANNQYIIAGILVAFSTYQLTKPDYWEFSLYFITGSAFLVMGLIRNKVFPRLHKFLTVLSWLLIIFSVLLLLFLVRTDG